MSGLIGLETEELKLQESYVHRLKQGQSLHLHYQKNDRILTEFGLLKNLNTNGLDRQFRAMVCRFGFKIW